MTCKKCGKDDTQVPFRRGRSACNVCEAARSQAYREQNHIRNRVAMPLTIFKVCSKCRIEKPSSDFGKKLCTPTGLHDYCLQCTKQSREDLHRSVLEKYHNRCARCGFTDVRVLQIDHVHGGGSIERQKSNPAKLYQKVLRDTAGEYQLLCANCNWITRVELHEYS